MNCRPLALCLPALLAACAGAPMAPAVEIPAALQPANTVLVTVVAARGVQIYECRAKKDQPGANEWAFVAPDAELFDSSDKHVGKHYAGPHWEAADGSKLVGAVKARADAPIAHRRAVPIVEYGSEVIHGPTHFRGESYDTASADIKAIARRWHFEQPYQVVPLESLNMVVVELVRKEEAPVFVCPSQTADIRRLFLQHLLQ